MLKGGRRRGTVQSRKPAGSLNDIDEWRIRTLSDPTSSISPAPDTFIAFLTARRAGLDELENLLAAEEPRWRLDAAGADHAYPNLWGQMRLQKLLVADALESSRKGNRNSALRAMEASWSLNSSLLGRPELVSQLIAVAVARMQVGALRKIDVDASPWKARMAGVDPRPRIFDSLLFQHPEHGTASWRFTARERALWLSRRGREGVPSPPVCEWLRRLVGPLKEPIERWQNVEDERQLRGVYREIRSAYMADALAPGEFSFSTMMSGIASETASTLVNVLERAERLVVDAELTERVLRARQARAANRGVWPASIPGIEVTRVKGAHWIYAVAPGGTASIALDRDLPPPEQAGVALPLRWTSG